MEITLILEYTTIAISLMCFMCLIFGVMQTSTEDFLHKNDPKSKMHTPDGCWAFWQHLTDDHQGHETSCYCGGSSFLWDDQHITRRVYTHFPPVASLWIFNRKETWSYSRESKDRTQNVKKNHTHYRRSDKYRHGDILKSHLPIYWSGLGAEFCDTYMIMLSMLWQLSEYRIQEHCLASRQCTGCTLQLSLNHTLKMDLQISKTLRAARCLIERAPPKAMGHSWA